MTTATTELATDLSIECGFARVYFFFDVADAIDLEKVHSVGGVNVARARLELKSAPAPNYIQFSVPPIVANLPDVKVGELTATARVKISDYGTISLRYSVPFSGSWEDFSALAKALRRSKELAQTAHESTTILLKELGPAMEGPYAPVSEDYFILNIQSFSSPEITVEKLLDKHQSELVALLLGESRKLSADEENNALSARYRYFEDDLVVVQWDSAFIYDSEEDSEAAESIIEFANTQLVQYLTYDARLDTELATIYKLEPIKSSSHSIFERRNVEKRAQKLRYFLADIREISDRANNSLKIIGDAFYARLYRGVATRLGLTSWQEEIDSKLATLSEIYQFVTDQAQHAQSEFIEMVIVALIALEVVMALLHH